MCLPFFISYFSFIYYPKAIASAVGSAKSALVYKRKIGDKKWQTHLK
jgi:hypothetical protein